MNGCEWIKCSYWNGKNCTHEGDVCIHRQEHDLIAEQEAEIDQLRADLAACREGRMKLQRVLADESQTRLYQERRADGAVEEMIESYKELTACRKENTVLRGLVAKHVPECVYCGETDMGKCVHGFPGCSRADDIMAAECLADVAALKRVGELEGACNRAADLLSVYVGDGHEWSLAPCRVRIAFRDLEQALQGGEE